VTPSTTKKHYDKQIKSYVLNLESQNCRITLPGSEHKELGLHQKYLVLQMLVPTGCPWSMELGVTDISGIRRRIYLTTMAGRNEAKCFLVRQTMEALSRGTWLFLAVNVHSFI
jgi:hypothetical protein